MIACVKELTPSVRIETDFLGKTSITASALYGINGARAVENFPLSMRPVKPELIAAFGNVKLAALKTIAALKLSRLSSDKEKAVEQACSELAEGLHNGEILSDALQGGAGTSLNMTVNEVIANRALQLIDKNPGDYSEISPSDDINRFQSTNDTFPTALRLAAIKMLKYLERSILSLQEAFQEKEKAFAHVVKIGRTEYQDAVLTTLGREMSTYAEALSRDRWRIYKCEERLRVINLGGTAIGSGLAAPREYIFQVAETLRDITGIGFARAENLCDATANKPLESSPIAVGLTARITCQTFAILRCYHPRPTPTASSGPESPPPARSCQATESPLPHSWSACGPLGVPIQGTQTSATL